MITTLSLIYHEFKLTIKEKEDDRWCLFNFFFRLNVCYSLRIYFNFNFLV